MKKIFLKIITVFNILIGAVSLINLGNDIFPALIKWIDFIKYILDFFKIIRDIVLFPLSFPLDFFFEVEIPPWIKSYLFIGLLFFNTFNYSYKEVCGHRSMSSPILLIFGDNRFRRLLAVLYKLILWPLAIVELAKHYFQGHYKRKHNVTTLWGKYIFWVIITTLFLIFINWMFWGIFDKIYNS